MVPTLSQVRAWSTGHLIEATSYWTQTADQWEDVFLQMRHEVASHGPGQVVRLRGCTMARPTMGAPEPAVTLSGDGARSAAGRCPTAANHRHSMESTSR
ncbi:conserved hypothetical protein [Mycobacterium ulcerans Agy99]|uniref:Uncharacterized protein n=1 Tax=Mycobacterium ulcerans (strain Agy99) TaxID=362242 RepID=A0PMZ3_MYCUA|nr:conserved hypothetical protein [Mycobacterium ulcerans Agy99]